MKSSSSSAKMTPLSQINQKKAIESRTRHRANATPVENRPTGRSTPKTPISVTPNSTPRGRKATPHRTVLFELNDNVVVSSSSGINLRSRSKLNIKDSAAPSLLNRSRSASNLKFDVVGPSLKRSVSVADINSPDSKTSNPLPPSDPNSGGESSRITVGVRIRPLQNREYGNAVVVDGQQVRVASDILSELGFTFDHVFVSSGENASSQQEVYEAILKPLVDNAFLGYNACLFAYGQTGSGKTYSMMGPDAAVYDILETTGVIPRFCKDLVNRCNLTEDDSGDGEHTTFTIEVSYVEVYNEKIRDLLDTGCIPTAASGAGLRVREHPVYGPYVADLTRHTVKSFADIQHWLTEGNKRRAVAATDMNDSSSRSHSLFTITLTQSTVQTSGNGVWSHERSKRSQINLVDLAGSERISHSNTSSDRLREGVSINKSLLTLGKVITALVEKRSFVPYRESILTWLLKESLGGNSRTAMLATVSPCSSHIDETVATLRYANQARAIVNTVRVNESPQDKIIRELQAEVDRLKETCHNLERGTPTKWARMVKSEYEEGKIAAIETKWNNKLVTMESELNAKIASAETESTRLADENQAWQNKAENLSVECNKWKTQAIQFQKELSEQKGKACKEQTVLHLQLDELKEKVSYLEQDLTQQQIEWNEKLRELQSQLKSEQSQAEKKIAALNEDWKQRLSLAEAAFDKERADLENKAEDALNQHAALEEHYNQRIAELEEKLHENSMPTVLQVTTAVQVQTSDVLDGSEEVSAEIKGAEYKKIKKEVVKLKKKLQEQFKLVEALKSKAERSSSLSRELEDVKTELNLAKSKCNMVEEEANQLRSRLDEIKSETKPTPSITDMVELTLSRAEATSAKAELEQTRNKIDILIKELSEYKSQEVNAQAQIATLREELRKAEETVSLAQQDLSSSNEELKKALAELKSSKENEFVLMNKLEDANSELELLKVLEERYKEKIDSSHLMETDVRSPPCFAAASTMTDPLMVSSDQLERKVNELQKRLDQKLNLIAELEKANSRYKEETSNAMQQLCDATGRSTQAEACSRDASEQLLQLQREFESQVEKSNKLAEEVADLTSKLNSAKPELENLRFSSSNKDEQLLLLKEDLKRLRDDVKSKDQMLKEVHEEMKQHVTTIESLRSETEKKDNQLEQLRVDSAKKEKKAIDDLSCKMNDILKCLNKTEKKAENKENSALQKYDLSEALAQVERKKKRIEKLKSRIDALEELFVSAIRTVNEKKSHDILKAEHAKIYNTMMEHSYLFHWDYLLRKARTYSHKYHIPYDFVSHDNVTGLVKHTLLQAKSYWFRVDFMSWFEKIEKEDRWSRTMDRDIIWEVEFGSYYDAKDVSAGSKCPVESDGPEPFIGQVELCCKPDFICTDAWKKSVVTRHLSGLRDDCRCLQVYLRNVKNETVLDLLKCIENMASQLSSELMSKSVQESSSAETPPESKA